MCDIWWGDSYLGGRLKSLKEKKKKRPSAWTDCVFVRLRQREQEGQGQDCAACFLWGRKWAGSDHRSTMSYCSELLLPKAKINKPLVPHFSSTLTTRQSVLSNWPVSSNPTRGTVYLWRDIKLEMELSQLLVFVSWIKFILAILYLKYRA